LVDGDSARITIEVRVELKPGILDAEADSVLKSLGLLGIPSVTAVRTAKVFALEFEGVDPQRAEAIARDAVDRLLANPVIHRVSVAAPSG
jgi:phosphoribosylformylglycinamidine synthase PurS subunit